MKRFSRREQVLIGLCVVVVAVIGAPAALDALAGGASSGNARETLSRARQERESHAAVLARLTKELDGVADARPAAALPARVMSQLDRRARALGITLREVRPLPERPLEGATGVPLQLSFTAPFPRAARFLAEIRTQPEGLAVDRVVITATAADSDQVSVQARVVAFSTAPPSREGSRG